MLKTEQKNEAVILYSRIEEMLNLITQHVVLLAGAIAADAAPEDDQFIENSLEDLRRIEESLKKVW